MIAHVIDMSGFEGRDPYDDYVTINEELKNFNESLIKKPQIVVANKMDAPEAKEHLQAFKKKVTDVPVYEISALENKGLQQVVDALADKLDTIAKKPLYEEERFESHVVYKFKKEQPFTVTNENGTWVIRGDEVEKLFRMSRLNTEEAFLRFSNQLKKLGIEDKLRELGAQDGDNVRILDYEFDYRL